MKIFPSLREGIQKLNRTERIILPALLVIFIFLMSIAVSPVNKLKEFEKIVISDSLFIEQYDSLWNHPALAEISGEKPFKEALLKLAEKDSIQLAVNLKDSVVCLYIKGVKIHQSSIEKIEKNGLFKSISTIQYSRIFSQPLKVESEFASIVKEPIVLRHAPKDTLEAALNAWKPDTLIQNPAFMVLRLEYGFDLVFEQNINPQFIDKWKKFWFYKKLGFKKAAEAVYCFLTLRHQEYHPTLTLKIPVDELRAIYRALPQNTYVVLYTNQQ